MTRLHEVSPGTRGSPPHAPRGPTASSGPLPPHVPGGLGGSGQPAPAPSTGHAYGPQAQNTAPPRTPADPCPSDRHCALLSPAASWGLASPPCSAPSRGAQSPSYLPLPPTPGRPLQGSEYGGCWRAWPHPRRPPGSTACAGTRRAHPQSPLLPGNLETPTLPRPRPGTTRRAAASAGRPARRLRPHRVPHGPPSSLCPSAGRVLTPGISVPPGNHSGVVLSVNSREMHSYLVG